MAAEAFDAAFCPSESDDDAGDPDPDFYDALSVEGLQAYLATDNLEAVKFLEIRADATQVSLSVIGERLPNLRELKLSNSTLTSLRDLGTSLKNLEVLWASRCGLTDLEGVSALPALKELYVAFNDVNDLSALSLVNGLEVLDLDTNSVASHGDLQYMAGCTGLIALALEGNPIAYTEDYRRGVFKILPALERLDDEPAGEEGEEGGAEAQLELETEARFVQDGIKHARMGIDESLFDAEAQLAELRDCPPRPVRRS
jgi:hypothetical protein